MCDPITKTCIFFFRHTYILFSKGKHLDGTQKRVQFYGLRKLLCNYVVYYQTAVRISSEHCVGTFVC